MRVKYPAEYVKGYGGNCTGLGNQALGGMELPIPTVRDNVWWTGGTREWFDALKNKRRIAEREMEGGFPVGTALHLRLGRRPPVGAHRLGLDP